MRTSFISLFFIPLFLIFYCYLTTAQTPDSLHDFLTTEPFGFPEFPSANLTTKWTDDEPVPMYANFSDGTTIQTLLLAETNETHFACGFYCTGTCTTFLFSIFIVQFQFADPQPPQVVWAANRDYPVGLDATLNFSSDGELVLSDSDGSTAWTAGKSVASVNLTDTGNLVLFDGNKSVIWQSFDHPTDCLLPGQKLFTGQKLKSSVSLTDWSSQKGMFSFQVTDHGYVGYVESNPAQLYYSEYVSNRTTVEGRSYVRFFNGSLFHSSKPSDPVFRIEIPEPSSPLYMKLMPDGHLNVFASQSGFREWIVVKDLTADVGECFYPLACGRISICSTNRQCSCPGVEYFKPVNDRKPNLGCSEVTPLTCNSTKDQEFITLENVSYFTAFTSNADMERVNMETCKQAFNHYHYY